MIKARRMADVEEGDLPTDLDDTQISYWKSVNDDGSLGCWWIYLPRAGAGCLSRHTITEHNDRTISVSPSIGLRKAAGHRFQRHGFLQQGEWHPCGDDR